MTSPVSILTARNRPKGMRGQPDCDQSADERLRVRHTSSTSNTVA
jgi:hypothetical protein